jgi:hypothetical protein
MTTFFVPNPLRTLPAEIQGHAEQAQHYEKGAA